MSRVKVEVEGATITVDRQDLAAWAGAQDGRAVEGALGDLDTLRRSAAAYVRANPRPEPDAQGAVNVPARQRMALIRRLAAGPASRHDLLVVMRDAAGYVGGDDWRNRMDELRGRGKRGGGHTALPLEEFEDGFRLVEPFPSLSASDREHLGRVLRLVGDSGDEAAAVVLGALFPGVVATPVDQSTSPLSTPSSSPSQRSSPRSADRKRS